MTPRRAPNHGRSRAWRWRPLAAALCAGVAGLVPASCSAPPRVEQSALPYSGPPIAIDSSGREHVLVLSAPSAGWSFTLDMVRESRRRQDLYVTIRRPNPLYEYAQVVVEQRLASPVPTSQPVGVFARVLGHDEARRNPDEGGAYSAVNVAAGGGG